MTTHTGLDDEREQEPETGRWCGTCRAFGDHYADQHEPLHEWSCPSCGAITRARMADAPPSDEARAAAVEAVARLFHDTYERLAPQFGYHTREQSAVPWERVPANNRALMMATVSAVLPEVTAWAGGAR